MHNSGIHRICAVEKKHWNRHQDISSKEWEFEHKKSNLWESAVTASSAKNSECAQSKQPKIKTTATNSLNSCENRARIYRLNIQIYQVNAHQRFLVKPIYRTNVRKQIFTRRNFLLKHYSNCCCEEIFIKVSHCSETHNSPSTERASNCTRKLSFNREFMDILRFIQN